jgi:hypothetical protein
MRQICIIRESCSLKNTQNSVCRVDYNAVPGGIRAMHLKRRSIAKFSVLSGATPTGDGQQEEQAGP